MRARAQQTHLYVWTAALGAGKPPKLPLLLSGEPPKLPLLLSGEPPKLPLPLCGEKRLVPLSCLTRLRGLMGLASSLLGCWDSSQRRA